jgi:hypothetical protein
MCETGCRAWLQVFLGWLNLWQTDCPCHSEQSEESFMVLILLVLLKIAPAGGNDKSVDSC